MENTNNTPEDNVMLCAPKNEHFLHRIQCIWVWPKRQIKHRETSQPFQEIAKLYTESYDAIKSYFLLDDISILQNQCNDTTEIKTCISSLRSTKYNTK